MILNYIDNLIHFAESAGSEMIEKLTQYAAKGGAKAAATAATDVGKKMVSSGVHAAAAASPKVAEKAASSVSKKVAAAGITAAGGYGAYKGVEHLANAGTADTANTAINAAAPVQKTATHLATKPKEVAANVTQHKTAAVKQAAVQHKAAAANHTKSQTLKARFDRSDEIYQKNMAANKAKFDAQDAKDKADLAAKHAAVNSKIAAQKSLAKLPSQQAYKARFDSAASGNGPVPSQWYKDRPIKTD